MEDIQNPKVEFVRHREVDISSMRLDMSSFPGSGQLQVFEFEHKKQWNGEAILIIGGSGDICDHHFPVANQLAAQGMRVFVYDPRGREEKHSTKLAGRSPITGQQTLQTQLTDASTVLDLVDSKIQGAKRTTVVATSMGAHIAAQLPKQRPIDHLVLIAPAIYPQELEEEYYKNVSLRQVGHRRDYFDQSRPIQSIISYLGQLTMVELQFDALVPKAMLDAIYLACPADTKRYLHMPYKHGIFADPFGRNVFLDNAKTILTPA